MYEDNYPDPSILKEFREQIKGALLYMCYYLLENWAVVETGSQPT